MKESSSACAGIQPTSLQKARVGARAKNEVFTPVDLYDVVWATEPESG